VIRDKAGKTIVKAAKFNIAWHYQPRLSFLTPIATLGIRVVRPAPNSIAHQRRIHELKRSKGLEIG
jgi:hypothetical protein